MPAHTNGNDSKPPEVWAAEAQRMEAEAVKARAEAAKAMAEADTARTQLREAAIKVEKAEIEMARERDKRAEELADNKFHYTYLFDKEVSETSAKACIAQLSKWERTLPDDEKLEVELVINSPGGSVFDGFALFDYIEHLHHRGHVVNTTAFGMAASMGGVLLQVGKRRAMGASAMLLIHEAQFGAMGSFGKVEDQVKLVKLMHERILSIYAGRSKMSKAQIKRGWSRKDWWIDAQTALKLGFIDEIR